MRVRPTAPLRPRTRRLVSAAATGLAVAAVCAWPATAQEPTANSSPWALPPADDCAPKGGLHGWPIGVDAPPISFQPGDTFAVEQLALLKAYFPPQIWDERDRFFFEGMRLEIGACFADYSPPAFFTEATQRLRGQARLLENSGLADYEAGLPFAPDDLEADAADTGLRWAWNVANRYQAGGFRGKFRVSDMVGRAGRAEPFEGEIFKLQLAHRSDLASSDYTAKGSRGKEWVAGGRMFEPYAAREHAWRQYRSLEHEASPERSDDLHAYLPTHRRVRRLSAHGIEGLYMPSFSVGVVQAKSLAVPIGLGGLGGVAGGGGGSVGGIAPSTTLATSRSGFEGMVIRPLLWSWNVLGTQDVLTPINSAGPLYPDKAAEDRGFGNYGLSFASDRWDLRRALVLEARVVDGGGAGDAHRVVHYVDMQTLVPLYYLSYDARGEALDFGMYAGRWSEERADYPRWPGDEEREIRIIDTVGATYANLGEFGGWRRESWEIVSTPPGDGEVRRLISVNNLSKGR